MDIFQSDTASRAIWLQPAPPEAVPSPIQGPVVGYDIRRDPFGMVEVLTLHPVVVLASGLSPAAFHHGLSLLDQREEPAVVCRVWCHELFGDEYLEDHEHRLVGLEPLARRDVVEAVARWALGDPV